MKGPDKPWAPSLTSEHPSWQRSPRVLTTRVLGIKCVLALHWRDSRRPAPSSPRPSPREFALHPFVVINPSHESWVLLLNHHAWGRSQGPPNR